MFSDIFIPKLFGLFGVCEKDGIIDSKDSGIKADLTFFDKDLKNKTKEDFKIIDRIIQNLREKLCLLIGKTEVANNVNIELTEEFGSLCPKKSESKDRTLLAFEKSGQARMLELKSRFFAREFSG